MDRPVGLRKLENFSMRKGMKRTGLEKELELKHVPEGRSCVICQETLQAKT